MEIIKKSCTIITLILIMGSFICIENTYSQSWIKILDERPYEGTTPQIIGNNIISLGSSKPHMIDKILIYNPLSNNWVIKNTSLRTNRHSFSTAVLNNKFFVAGGCVGDIDSLNHVRTGKLEMYDPASDTWTSRKPMLTPRQHAQLVAYENQLYAIGGSNIDTIPINTFEVYDPLTDNWKIKTTTPWKGYFRCWGTVVYNKKIYILGETNQNNNRSYILIIYDPRTNEFSIKTPENLKNRWGYGVTLSEDKIFIIGGTIGGVNEKPIKTVTVYNIIKDQWTTYPDLPVSLNFPEVIQINNKIYIFGGVVGPGNPNKSVFEYDLISQNKIMGKHPYSSNKPILYPKKFDVPGLNDCFGITFTHDGKTFYVNKFGIVKAPGSNPTAAILEYDFKDGAWIQGKPLGFSMVKNTHDEAPFLSPDGKRIYFNSDRPLHHGNFNIYYAEKNDTGWSQAYQVKGKINTSAQMEVSPAVASDGTLYFSTQLPSAGNGNFYYSKLLPNGEYDTPISLGDSINTSYDEWGIYVSPDQNLMLFMSSRPGGYGGCDIYLSKKKNGRWSKAVNLGPKINTSADEIFSCISPDGNYLFFSRSGDIFYMDWIPILTSLK